MKYGWKNVVIVSYDDDDVIFSYDVLDKLEDIDINNIRYADDTVLISDSEEKMQRLVDVLSD